MQICIKTIIFGGLKTDNYRSNAICVGKRERGKVTNALIIEHAACTYYVYIIIYKYSLGALQGRENMFTLTRRRAYVGALVVVHKDARAHTIRPR